MIPLTLDPLSAFLIVFLLLVAEKERRYFKNRPAPMVELPVPSPSPEVMIEADRQFRELQRSLIRMVMDVCGCLGILLLSAYTCRIICLGKESLSCGEMSHVFLLVLWLLTCVAFHTGVLRWCGGEAGEVVLLMYFFNLLTLGMTVYIDEAAKAMLEPMIMMGRVVGSLAFLDWRHGLCCNSLFAARRFQEQSHEDFTQMLNSAIAEFCVFVLILLVSWALEFFLQKWIGAMVAASDLDMALRAAKSVIRSSCDAEAELSADLHLQQVSSKLAHLLGRQPHDLEGQNFGELLNEESRQRFTACCQGADSLNPSAVHLTVTAIAGGCPKDLEARICSFSLSRGAGRYILALTEVQDGPAKAIPDIPEEVWQPDKASEISPEPMGPGLTAELLECHSWVSKKSRNLSSLSEVKVQVDAQTLEIQDIHIFLNTSHWKKSRKTFLKECILPGMWDDFRRWLEGSVSKSKGRQGADPPFIVPFGFSRVMGGVACARTSEVKHKVGPTGRNELSLRLRHIFIRRPATHEGGQARECPVGTQSIASRGTL